MSVLVLLFSDDIVTIQLGTRGSRKDDDNRIEEEGKKREQYGNEIPWNYIYIGGGSTSSLSANQPSDFISNDDTKCDARADPSTNNSVDITVVDNDDDLSTSSSEDESEKESDEEEYNDDDTVDEKQFDEMTTRIIELDWKLSLRALAILCLYCVAHGSLFECVSTILETISPTLNSKYMFVIGTILLRLSGGLSWYVDFMDDEDGNVYKQVRSIRRQKQKILRYLSDGIFSSSDTATTKGKSTPFSKPSWKNTMRKQRLKLFILSDSTQAIRCIKRRFPMVIFLLDLFSFYLVYLSCQSIISSYLVNPMISIPKMHLLDTLPSSELNITSGFHPSLVHRYLTSSLHLYSETDHVHDAFIQIIQDEVMTNKDFSDVDADNYIDSHSNVCNDDIYTATKDKDKDNCEAIGSETGTIQDKMYNVSSNKNNHAPLHKRNEILNDIDSSIKDDSSDISSQILAIKGLEEKWSSLDDEYLREVTSPWSYSGFFGSYDETFTSCPKHFAIYSLIFVFALYLLQKVGVSAENILA